MKIICPHCNKETKISIKHFFLQKCPLCEQRLDKKIGKQYEFVRFIILVLYISSFFFVRVSYSLFQDIVTIPYSYFIAFGYIICAILFIVSHICLTHAAYRMKEL